MRLKRIRNAFAVSRSQSCKMSSMTLSASLASVKAYDAFNLSPITVVARMLASHRISVSSNSRAIASALFAAFERLAGQDVWLAEICDMRLVAAHKSIVKSLLGQIDPLG